MAGLKADFDTLTDILADAAPDEISDESSVKNFRRMLLVARDTTVDDQTTMEVLRLLSKYADGTPTESEAITADTMEFFRASRRVCRVEVEGAGSGTGFLVGPDLVLTATHVLFGVGGFPSPALVTCRFDYFVWAGDRAAEDVPVKPRTDIGDSWIVAFSDASFGSFVPMLSQLDYALIRLAEPIGLMGLPHNPRRRRGWMDGSAAEVPPVEKSEITILQHPNGRLLRFSRGQVRQLMPENLRVRYRAATDSGTSGGPVLNAGKQIVGLHTFSRPDQQNSEEQEGVNFQGIFADLAAKSIALPRYPPRRRN